MSGNGRTQADRENSGGGRMPASEESLRELFAAEKGSPYREWLAQEGLPVYRGHHIEDLRSVEVAPWKRRGGKVSGAYIIHDASEWSNDCYVLDIPPGSEVPPQ